jgi:NTE family protein
MGNKQEAFGIFEGGGAKGVALVGALKAIEDAGIELVGWGGTSAGAIVAALAAAGWGADALRELMLNQDFTKFLDQPPGRSFPLQMGDLKALWDAIGPLVEDVKKTNGNALWLSMLLLRLRKHPCLPIFKEVAQRIAEKRGLFPGEEFLKWINQQLEVKISARASFQALVDSKKQIRQENGERDPLPEPLYVVATDYVNRRAKIYGMKHKDDQIADAVRASMSIPYFFEPFNRQVDGGLVSNFPSWVFDHDRETYGQIPTIGVRLVINGTRQAEGQPRQFLQDIVGSALEGRDELDAQKREDFVVIPVDITQFEVETFDFDVPRPKRVAMFKKGQEDAEHVLRTRRLGRTYDPAYKAFMFAVKQLSNLLPAEKRNSLRFNLFRPCGGDRRIAYHFNMDTDPDRRLVLHSNEGAVATAWINRGIVVTGGGTGKGKPAICWREQSDGTFKEQELSPEHYLRDETIQVVGKAESIVSRSVPNGKDTVGVFSMDSIEKLDQLGITKDGKIVESTMNKIRETLNYTLGNLAGFL